MTDIEVLARTIYGEARGGDIEDATAIACVILNRVGYRNWPNNVSDVCLQPMQFSVWNENDAGRPRMLRAQRKQNEWFDKCWELAEAAVKGGLRDPTRTSTHYHTRAVKPRWSKGKTPCYQTQGHLYFNNIDTPAPKNAAEALNQERPLTHSRTAVGAVVATVGSAAGVVEVLDPEQTTALSAAFSAFGWAELGQALPHIVALVGIGYAFYARWDDRRKGLR